MKKFCMILMLTLLFIPNTSQAFTICPDGEDSLTPCGIRFILPEVKCRSKVVTNVYKLLKENGFGEDVVVKFEKYSTIMVVNGYFTGDENHTLVYQGYLSYFDIENCEYIISSHTNIVDYWIWDLLGRPMLNKGLIPVPPLDYKKYTVVF